MKKKHIEVNQPQLACNLCDMKANTVNDLWDHKVGSHVGQPFDFSRAKDTSNKDHLINLIAEQNIDIVEEISNLKKSVKEVLGQLINEFEDNMKVMGEKTAKQHIETKELFRKIEKKLEEKMKSSSTEPSVSSSKPSAKTPEENMQKKPSPSAKQSNMKSPKPSRPAF